MNIKKARDMMINQWAWLRNHPQFDKEAYAPTANMLNRCPCCQYVILLFAGQPRAAVKENGETTDICQRFCPIKWPSKDGSCDSDGSPYYDWLRARTYKQRAASAEKVRKLAEGIGRDKPKGLIAWACKVISKIRR